MTKPIYHLYSQDGKHTKCGLEWFSWDMITDVPPGELAEWELCRYCERADAQGETIDDEQ